MAISTNINIRMDQELKNQFESICSELGMSMSTAINIFAKATVRKQGIPFELTLQAPQQPLIIDQMTAQQIADEVLIGFNAAEKGATLPAKKAFALARDKVKA